jgi:hypothetical protein
MTAMIRGALLLGASALPVLAGCSSNSTPACNPCDNSGQTMLVGHDTNPDGIAYPNPAGGYGRMVRAGVTPGSVLQNYKFLGYPLSSEAKGLQTVALADYYDPCGKRWKLLHITVAGVWCAPCNQETDAIVAAKADLASKGVVVIQALDDGPTEGVPATTTDLNYWVSRHMSNFTELLDPGLQNLGGFFQASAIPWNADLDPRTMELVDSTTGWAGSVDLEVQAGFNALPVKPSYPIPGQCNGEL